MDKIVTIDDTGEITKKKVTFKYPRVIEPDHISNYGRKEWRREQFQKCIYGDGLVCGKFYFFFNFCTILSLKEEIDEITNEVTPAGKRKPEFRVSQVAWFEFIEWCKKKRKGIVCVKRRRAGFSWIAAADVLHDAIFKPYSKIGMNSKTEKDSRELFKKVKFLYDNMPSWIRPGSEARNRDAMFFGFKGKDENGNVVMKGTQSEIECVAPTVSAWEGRMLSKWVADEAGKCPDIVQMFSFTEDCLSDGGTSRNGQPIIFGTSGETDGAGAGLRDIWYAHESYDLMQFFYSGTMGLIVDPFGNDDVEAANAWIINQRNFRSKQPLKNQIDFIQKYPLSPQEAFMESSGGGVGDPMIVQHAIEELTKNPASCTRGLFAKTNNGSEFVPDILGNITMYEPPKPHLKNAYVAGCDPVDNTNTQSNASYISAYFVSKQHGTSPPHIVAQYYGKPAKPETAYEQIIMACQYYGCQILIEKNRPGMINYFDQNGCLHLLRHAPIDRSRIYAPRPVSFGVHMNDTFKNYMISNEGDYINEYWEYIPDLDLLKETQDFGKKNTDRVMAFGLALAFLQDDASLVKINDGKEKKSFLPKLVKINGKLIRQAA